MRITDPEARARLEVVHRHMTVGLTALTEGDLVTAAIAIERAHTGLAPIRNQEAAAGT